MRFLLLGLFISLYGADDHKPSSPIPIPTRDPQALTDQQQYAAEIYKVTKKNGLTHRDYKRKIYMQKMHEQKHLTHDDLKKSSQAITQANKKYIYDNPEFTSKDENQDK